MTRYIIYKTICQYIIVINSLQTIILIDLIKITINYIIHILFQNLKLVNYFNFIFYKII